MRVCDFGEMAAQHLAVESRQPQDMVSPLTQAPQRLGVTSIPADETEGTPNSGPAALRGLLRESLETLEVD